MSAFCSQLINNASIVSLGSNIAHDDHRTREHYKSLQKQKAFNMMKDIAPMVSIPPLAVSRANEM